MANIMQQFRAKNKVSRNGFDVNKRLCFSAKAGELLPTYSRVLMTGQTVEVGNKWETTTAPVNTAAYTRFKEYYEWYFVPINLLWNKYNTWSLNLKDQTNSATSINGASRLTDNHPYFTTYDIQAYLVDSRVGANQFGFARLSLTQKLLHYLGYGAYDDGYFLIDQFKLSPWRLLAYQKICQDWHRFSQWENTSPERYNINYISGSEESLHIPMDQLDVTRQNMFDLNYCNWNKDLFMGLLPNSQYGDAASIMAPGAYDFSEPINILSGYPNAGNVTSTPSSSVAPYQSVLAVGGNANFGLNSASVQSLARALGIDPNSVSSRFTILAFRQQEALQKYKEITQSNPYDYPSQKEAHFDFRPNEAYSERSRLIHSQSADIVIRPVINQNITENDDASLNAADIAGYGHNTGGGKTKKFTADVDGVLMCIYHVVPLLDYALPRIDPDNLKTSYTDYPIPEFDKTGMQQVPLAWLTNSLPDWSSTFTPYSKLLGYAPNYIDVKTDIDEVKGAFYNGGLEAWVAPITNEYLYKYLFGSNPTQAGQYTFNGLDYRFFKVNPSITDSIFSGENVNASVRTDKFWINCYHGVDTVAPLDRDGLPY